MMRRLLGLAILIGALSALQASPVRRGQWKIVRLADGTSVRAEARGDEHLRWWQAADGRCYVETGHTKIYREVSPASLRQAAAGTRAAWVGRMRKRRAAAGSANRLEGRKHALMILVDFSGKTFSMAGPKDLFLRICNEPGYSEHGFGGSVRDYFLEQSHGRFDLSFDVVGPVTMPHPFAYYGRNDDDKVGEMIREACVAVDGETDFSKYDWDGDGEADLVYVVYAGYGQADHSDNDDYIWPHMYHISAYPYYRGRTLRLDNTIVDAYACSNEADYNSELNGIGTICHELSHCLGLPDMYDTGGSGNYGMGAWDVMDYGCNNDNGKTPGGYTGYEKMALGWSMPEELTDTTNVSGMQPLSMQGRSYVVYNPATRNEFCIIDNRQPRGFDRCLPGHGMIITHVDYDKDIWDNNIVNATGLDQESQIDNTHRRCTIYHADNDAGTDTEAGDAYPRQGNDSLTAMSRPAVSWYNADDSGNSDPGFAIMDIREGDDGTMSFRFVKTTDADTVGRGDAGVLLRETFDQCAGVGGNDGRFRGRIAWSELQPDLKGWDYMAGYGGDRCALFGKTTAGTGTVSSPWFPLTADTLTLTFRAAGWDAAADGTRLMLTLNGSGVKFVQSDRPDVSLVMTKGAWTDYRLQIVGSGSTSITFAPSRRFFLDEVMVTKGTALGIAARKHMRHPTDIPPRIYGIDGRYVGTDLRRLPRGIYIMDGKKVVKTGR